MALGHALRRSEEGSDVGNKLILGPFRTTLLVVYEVSQEFGLDVGVYRGKIRIPDLDCRFRCMHNTQLEFLEDGPSIR